jgi:hypothetical protein
MADQFTTQPVNPIINIRPVSVPAAGREVTNTQTQLAALPPGTILEGFVLTRDANNNPILRTAVGDLQMQSDVFVKTGSQMVIRVDTTSESRARIVSIDGLEPAEYAAQNARMPATDTIAPSQLLSRMPGAAPGTLPPPANQPPLQAMLLTPAIANPLTAPSPFLPALPAGSVVPPMLMKLQAGAALKVVLVQLQLPGEVIAATTPQMALPQPPNAPRPLPGNNASPQAPQQPALPSQAPLQEATMASPQAAKIASQPALQVQMPNAHAALPSPPPGMPALLRPPPIVVAQPQAPRAGAASATVPTPAPANTLPGVVIGHEADGGNVVQTHFGMLKIFTPAPLPIHSKLTLQVEPETKPAPVQNIQPSVVPPEDSDGITSLSRDWTKLSQAIAQLGMQDPPAAHDMMAALPQMGHKLASGMLFFMAAVKGGDLQQWLGKRAVSALESQLPELAAKLKGEMGQIQQLMLHSPLDHWSGVMIPMLHEGQIDYARMYLRDEQSEGGEKQGGKGKDQRFILEVEMSHLGEMQFDGFVRQGQAKKQFDLIIRTVRPLPSEMDNEIRALFETAMGTTGYTGYLAFQQGSHHFVRPLAGAQPNMPPPLDHTILA